jgi:predicted acyltransferase
MQKMKRVLTIDVMRGLTLFLMLFVNDLYAPGVSDWLTHRPADFDGMGLADWVFPGFLFMVGMAVPFAIQSRLKNGDTFFKIILHIIIRVISLLIIGVLMMNVHRLNPELTGMSKNLWAILMYLSVFLIWNQYGGIKSPIVLKGIGTLGLLILVFLYRSGTSDDSGWLITGWWGILGLIGWGYLVTALVYLFVKDNIFLTGLIWLFFVGLNIISQLGLMDYPDFVNTVFGVILAGNIPSLVMAGLFFSLILRKLSQSDTKRFVLTGSIFGLLVLLTGFIFRHWFIISKIQGTPSWSMICTGISILLFIILFLLIDMLGYVKWTAVFKPAGQNSLTTYLAPDILYYVIWMTGVPVLFYKQSEHSIVVAIGSLVWAFAMIGFAAFLSKKGIRLKL